MLLPLLFATGLFAGTVDAIAGGGGLISLPILLSIGMPPHLAFGTNKLQGTIGTLVATFNYYRHGLISIKKIYHGVIFGLVGSILGAVLAQVVSSGMLRDIIPVLLFIILIYTVCFPKLGHNDEKPKISEFWFYLLFGFALAFYDGFFGPGTGSLWVFALTFFLGYNLIKATAYTKVFNLNSSFVATICFALGGNIDYRYALCMAVGQIVGGRLGAHLAITRGARLIRPLFLYVVSLTIATLIYKSYANSVFFIYLTEQFSFTSLILVAVVILISALFIYLRLGRRQKSGLP